MTRLTVIVVAIALATAAVCGTIVYAVNNWGKGVEKSFTSGELIQLLSVAELQTVRATYQEVGDSEDCPRIACGLVGDRVKITGKIRVGAGTNLKLLGKDDVSVRETDKEIIVAIELPYPEVQTNELLEIVDLEQHCGIKPRCDSKVVVKAEKSIRDAAVKQALQDKILEHARVSAEQNVPNIISVGQIPSKKPVRYIITTKPPPPQ